MPSLQTTVVWFGNCGVAGTMIQGQETRIRVITVPAPPHLWLISHLTSLGRGLGGVLRQGLRSGSAMRRWNGLDPSSQRDRRPSLAGREGAMSCCWWRGHRASVEAVLIMALALLHCCQGLLLLAYPALPAVGELERPV